MAIAIDASSQFSSDPTNAQPVTYTGPTVSAPAGAVIWVFACCDAPPSTPTSTIAITGVTGGHTAFEVLTINQASFGGANAPITLWNFTANGTPFEVTQQGQNGAQNSQAQAVYVITGSSGLESTGNFRGTGAPTISDTASAGAAALCGFIDSPNTLDTLTPTFSTTTDQSVVPDSDTVPSFFGHRLSLSGAFSVGVALPPNQGGTNGIMVLLASEEEPASGVLDVVLPVPDAVITGRATAESSLDVVLPVIVADFIGESSSGSVLDVVLPVPVADFAGEASSAGQLDVILPVPDVDLDGQVLVPATGILNIALPVPNVNLDGVSAAGGQTVGPCGWTIPEPLCPSDAWTNAGAAVQAAARDYAALILWASTGRQFGLCEVSVRPCGQKPCNDGLLEFAGWNWLYGTWTPYTFQGTWYNCACPDVCCCDPRCQVRLMGPVDSILEVTIGGVAVDPSAYRVDDDHWLVRTDGECWPECADMDTDDGDRVFVVTYLRGTAVPSALLQAAASLAMEWAAACVGAECRLSSNVQSLVRSGISIELVDPQQILQMGLTGLPEVDRLILALNPYGKKERGRIYAPELRVPRMVTSP